MNKLLACFLFAVPVGCGHAVKPRLGVLPEFDHPPCTDRTRESVGEDECARRITAFVGRVMRATVIVRARKAAGKETAEERIGAGVIVDAHGRVFTAYHVVRGMTEIMSVSRQIGGAGGKLVYGEMPGVPMRVASYVERLDLAMLVPDGPIGLPGPITVNRMVRTFAGNEKLWVVGSRPVSYGGVVITGLTETVELPNGETRPDLIRIGVPAIERDLGGPVLSADGNVVGIMVVADEATRSTYFVPVTDAVQLFGLTSITEVDL